MRRRIDAGAQRAPVQVYKTGVVAHNEFAGDKAAEHCRDSEEEA